MMVNRVDNRAAFAVPVPQVLTRIVGGEIVRIDIGVELTSLHAQLTAAPANDPRVRSIAAWHQSFSRALRHPNPQQVTREYVQELVNLLRGPAPFGIEQPFPAELFGMGPMPLIRYIVEKMRDRRSLFYSEPFDQEAVRVLAAARPVAIENALAQNIPNGVDPNIPRELLEQLRLIEGNIARQVHEEREGMDRLRALQGRVRQRERALLANIDRVAEQHLEEGERIREEAERIRLLDLEQRALIVGAANELRQQAEDLRAEAVRLQHNLDVNRERLGELERANMQLQIEIHNTRSQINDNKSHWLLSIGCIFASFALSWTLQMPIVLIPPK